MNKHVKVAVTGAAGQIGYALLFRLASGQVFGPNTTIDLSLIEIEPSLPTLEGVVMELQDCAFPLIRKLDITADPNQGFNDVNWAILVGSAPRKAGMERSDLLQINGGIFSSQGKALNDHAADNIRVFVVGNPCNTNALIAMNNAPDIPNNRFFAMTRLDQNRARMQLALKAGVTVETITQMVIWGNHSATQYPDFYNAKINGSPVVDVISDHQWLENQFIPMIQKRGAAVIKARGASSAASAANAALESVNAIVNNTPKNDCYSVALCSSGQYGVDEGLIFSFPCRTQDDGVAILEGFEHNDFGKQKFQATLEELRHERDIVKNLGLI